MGDTKEEAEWRAEFERFGEEQVRSSLASGLFSEPKRQFAFRWLGDEALARRNREKKILFLARIGGVFGIVAALIAASPIIKGWLASSSSPSMIASNSPGVPDPFAQGVAAWNREDYVTALQLFRPLAERGNIHAQHLLGVSYDEGLGVPQDDIEAAKWYQLAADGGDDVSQYRMTQSTQPAVSFCGSRSVSRASCKSDISDLVRGHSPKAKSTMIYVPMTFDFDQRTRKLRAD